MKQGFSLLEVLVGMMVASILLTASLTIYNQISKSSQRLQKITSLDTQVMILRNRLQKDLTGISPLWFTQEQAKELKSYQASPKEQPKQEESPETNNQNKFFYATNADKNQFHFATWTTINAMQLYGVENQRFVRVIYKMIKDDKNATYTLMRKELHTISYEINTEEFLKDDSFYPIVSHIQDFSISYGFINQPKKEQKTTTNQTTLSKDIKTEWLNEWGVFKEETASNEYKPALPEFIKINITFEKEMKSRYTYELLCTIPIDSSQKIISILHKEHKEAAKQAQTRSSNPQPSAKGNAAQTTGGNTRAS